MSSTFNNHNNPHGPKREPNENNVYTAPSPSPPSLKVNRDSHVIKKPNPSPSSAVAKPRHPVIIYTHTPKVIHTNTKDFMALVQKLTGMPPSDENTTTDIGGKSINQSVSDPTVDRKYNRNRCVGAGHNNYPRSYSGTGNGNGNGNGKRKFFNNMMISEDSEASSVITIDENIGDVAQVSSFLPYSSVAIPPPPPHGSTLPPSPSMYDAAGINYGTYMPQFSIFPPANPADNFVFGNQPLTNFEDPFFFAPNMRSSFSSSSSSGFDVFSDFREFQ